MGWSVPTRWCQYDKQMSYSISAFTCLYIWGCPASFLIKPFIGSSCSAPTRSHISSSVFFALAESYFLWSPLHSNTCNISSGHIKTDFLSLAYWEQQSPLCYSLNLICSTSVRVADSGYHHLFMLLKININIHQQNKFLFCKNGQWGSLEIKPKIIHFRWKKWSAHRVKWRMFIFPLSAEEKPNDIFLGVTVLWLVNFCVLFMAL